MLPSRAGSCDGRQVKTPSKTPAKAKLKEARVFPTLGLELLLIQSSGGPVCGVDEAGRGPWAGPVSAGAVILNPDDLPAGIDDSKALTHARREALEIEIKARAIAWGVGFASVEEIAELNILHATGLAMCRAIEALQVQPVAALVDGNYRFKLPCDVQTVVGGDGLSLSIAAASILAKTARDRLMVELDAEYPGYGFAGHKGYNAPVHQEALKTLGPCPAHRRSWAPIKALLET
ncbi:MAG: ribonuclease HII [Brevundimonas sp.]|nr:MAG: ribonuclease HII [Brevundimonas sp.]